MADLCQTLGVLPGPGGLFDQDPLWVERIKVVLEARARKAEKENKSRAR